MKTGQLIEVAHYLTDDWVKRIFIASPDSGVYHCVHTSYEADYDAGREFRVCQWNHGRAIEAKVPCLETLNPKIHLLRIKLVEDTNMPHHWFTIVEAGDEYVWAVTEDGARRMNHKFFHDNYKSLEGEELYIL